MSRTTSVRFEVQHSDSEEEPQEARRGHASKRDNSKAQQKEDVAKPKMTENKDKKKLVPRGVSKNVKMMGVRQSAENILRAAAQVQKATNETWALAPQADMNKYRSAKDPEKCRRQLIVRKAALDVAASGAATHVIAVLNKETRLLNTAQFDEIKNAPWLPSVTAGARLQIIQFLTAYAQTALLKASIQRKELSKKKRVSGDLMAAGFEHADEIFSGQASNNKFIFVESLKKKRVKSLTVA